MIVNFTTRTKLALLLIAILTVLALDHIIQQAVFIRLAENGKVAITPFFNLVRIWNPGISFGLLQKLPYGQSLLSCLALIIVSFLTLWLFRTNRLTEIIAICLIVSGALANVWDRFHYSAVADYLDFHAFNYHWPAFNIPDTAIFIGVGFLLIDSLFLHSNNGQLKNHKRNSR